MNAMSLRYGPMKASVRPSGVACSCSTFLLSTVISLISDSVTSRHLSSTHITMPRRHPYCYSLLRRLQTKLTSSRRCLHAPRRRRRLLALPVHDPCAAGRQTCVSAEHTGRGLDLGSTRSRAQFARKSFDGRLTGERTLLSSSHSAVVRPFGDPYAL